MLGLLAGSRVQAALDWRRALRPFCSDQDNVPTAGGVHSGDFGESRQRVALAALLFVVAVIGPFTSIAGIWWSRR